MRCLSPSSFSVLSSAFPSQSSSSFLLFRSCTTETKEKKKVLVLFGPTGIGKTTVAIGSFPFFFLLFFFSFSFSISFEEMTDFL